MNKACIITTPCSGKSTFRESCASKYKGVHIIEQPLENVPVHSCILTGNHIPKQDEFIYAIVLIDKERLIQQGNKREKENIGSEWVGENLFSHPEKGYDAVQQTAEKYNIPVFNTFEKALDFIITKMDDQRTIVLVLKNGKGFGFQDVELIARHINGKWKSENRPRIICLWNKASEHYQLGNMELIPLRNEWRGTWARMQLYSPEMDQYRPFLYVDLDTAIIQSLENIFDLVKDPAQFIALEDFYQPGKLATGLVWFPANSNKVQRVWNAWKKKASPRGRRMDFFLWRNTSADNYWQRMTDTIHDFKPSKQPRLTKLTKGMNLVCFHGDPRIFAARDIEWIDKYVSESFTEALPLDKLVTVIIPYNKDRGWLKRAIESVPKEVQLLVSQGEGGWPENFNKVLPEATGKYIKYLHEDDMLTPNCIKDSVQAMEDQEVDFIHGKAIEIYAQNRDKKVVYTPEIKYPTSQDLQKKNVIHSTTTMYRREIFDKIGGFDETLNTQEEYEFNLRCLEAGFKIGYCDTSLAYYRRHPEQKVRTVSVEEKKKEKQQVNDMYK